MDHPFSIPELQEGEGGRRRRRRRGERGDEEKEEEEVEEEEGEEEGEDQSEAYRSLPEVQEDFGIVRKSGRRFDDRQMVENRSQRKRKEEKGEEAMKSENSKRKGKDKRAVEDKCTPKEFGEQGISESENATGKARNQKQNIYEMFAGRMDAKEGVTLEFEEEEDEVISGLLPHPIRHFERSDHLCQDVQRLRK